MLLQTLSKIFGMFVKRRNRLFDSEKPIVTFLGIPVISVGNLSVGGTGKTPFTKMLAQSLLRYGYKPAIIGSGYGRKSKGLVVVSDGDRILSNPVECGDEMFMLAESLNVPILVHNKKYKAGITAIENFDIDCIIIDDGFQHRRLNRDSDILLIDSNVFLKPYLIPYGRLREPLESLRRADIICLMNCEVPSNYKGLFPPKKTFHAETKVLVPRNLNIIEEKPYTVPVAKSVIALSAIANPHRFTESLKSKGMNVEKEFFFKDHYYFDEKDIAKVIRCCNENRIEHVLTTEKDAVKLKEFINKFTSSEIFLSVLPIEIEIRNKELFDELIKPIFEDLEN